MSMTHSWRAEVNARYDDTVRFAEIKQFIDQPLRAYIANQIIEQLGAQIWVALSQAGRLPWDSRWLALDAMAWPASADRHTGAAA